MIYGLMALIILMGLLIVILLSDLLILMIRYRADMDNWDYPMNLEDFRKWVKKHEHEK